MTFDISWNKKSRSIKTWTYYDWCIFLVTGMLGDTWRQLKGNQIQIQNQIHEANKPKEICQQKQTLKMRKESVIIVIIVFKTCQFQWLGWTDFCRVRNNRRQHKPCLCRSIFFFFKVLTIHQGMYPTWWKTGIISCHKEKFRNKCSVMKIHGRSFQNAAGSKGKHNHRQLSVP